MKIDEVILSMLDSSSINLPSKTLGRWLEVYTRCLGVIDSCPNTCNVIRFNNYCSTLEILAINNTFTDDCYSWYINELDEIGY